MFGEVKSEDTFAWYIQRQPEADDNDAILLLWDVAIEKVSETEEKLDRALNGLVKGRKRMKPVV